MDPISALVLDVTVGSDVVKVLCPIRTGWGDTGHTVPYAQFQVVQPRAGLFHKRFVADGPSQRNGGEGSPPVVCTEFAGSFVADAEQGVVAVGVAVADTGEETNKGVIVCVRAHARMAVFFGQKRTQSQVVVEVSYRREVSVAGRETIVLVVEVAVTYQPFEAVFAPCMVVARSDFQSLAAIVAFALRSGTVVVVFFRQGVIVRISERLADACRFVQREHHIGLPSLNGFYGDVTRHLVETDAGIAFVFVLDFHRIDVVQAVEVFVIGSVFVIDGFRWVTDNRLAVSVGIVVQRILLPADQGVEVELQFVVPSVLGKVQLHLQVFVVALAHDSFIVAVNDVGGVSRGFRTTVHRKRMVVLEARLAADGFQPVGVVAFVGIGGASVDDVMRIHELRCVCPFRERYVTRISDVGFLIAASGLGGNQDDTVGTTGTVDGGSRSVFQYVDGSDVFGRYGGEVAFDTVYQDKRVGVTRHGIDTTQHDGRRFGRVTRRVSDAQTGNLTFYQFGCVGNLTSRKVFCLDGGYGTGHIAFALRTVTDDDYFVHHLGVFFQLDDLAGFYFACLYLNGLVADVADDQRSVGCHFQRELTVEVGNRAVGIVAFLYNVGSDDAFTVRVYYLPADGPCLLGSHHSGFRVAGLRKHCLRQSGGQHGTRSHFHHSATK